ncbi:hypothetical protein D7B24_001122 [Verticillium nonalfalfae]|uniref:Glucanase n=3 Tax=Verticillium TaxID=1036719 RepID=C9SAE8_VERA1|nr:exoglucanase [Verticillium alfalfae VaMs.102]XP_028498042.1 uncharacterized protein D7B24_001122 [Verticillium nonalfalfae]EEY16316.1 exoglucanase [Verticillium alfalfae VaMs.102]RNJ59884.1 hypothetical protein D7B24_001122 [Verticillium nonalfalfae]
MKQVIVTSLSLLATAMAQQVGTETPETHPPLTWKDCSSGTCSDVQGSVVVDANWRWVHEVGGYENCYDGNDWTGLCTGADDCAKNCAVEGENYATTYGITTSGNALRLNFVTEHQYGTNVGSRTYLLQDDETYQMFTLLNNEFSFTVDLSTVECGINSALYFVPMKPDGGKSDEPNNAAGAKYGVGYCDSQCARDLKFVNGKGNIEGWTPSATDPASGVGNLGACCAEIDVWESNAWSYALTPHGCEDNNYHVCGDGAIECGGTYSEDRFAGKCDANGCDYNPYRLGNPEFYGKNKVVNTNEPFTVVTRFSPNELSTTFIQNDEVIVVPVPNSEGVPSDSNTVNPEYCTAYNIAWDERDRQAEIGGFGALNSALALPMVVVLSIWADHYANMLWLDSIYPPEDPTKPGAARGACPTDSGVPSAVIAQNPSAHVVWSDIRYGPIGSTYDIPA